MSNSYPGGLLTLGAVSSNSVLFDGSGDFLTLNSTSLNLSSSDFTIETWIYAKTTDRDSIVGSIQDSDGAGSWMLMINNSGPLRFYARYNGGSTLNYNVGSGTLSTNQWNHVAVTRSGANLRFFLNGLQVGATDTTLSTYSIDNAATSYYVGRTTDNSAVYTGLLSNLRIIKGTALYTAPFTPPSAPLTPVTNTLLLTCQSPTIIDNSVNAFSITVSGDTKVIDNTPFTGYKGFDPALGAAAGGVWTLEQATSYQSNRTWPIYDPYFKQTTLLLHGNGTNNANNQSFIDSSTNNFAITRNGNTTQGSFTPFSQTGFSYYFDTNSDEGLSYPTAANTVVGAVAGVKITYEFWVYCAGIINETGFYMGLAGASPSIGVNGRWAINFIGSSTTSDQTIYYYWTTGTGSADTATSTVPLKQHRWNHIAICIDATTASSSTITIYTNGIGEVFTGKNLSTQTTANDPGYQQYIGGRRDDGSQTWNGYVRDFRVVRGSLVYTSNFTPPTKPLTAIPGTVLLTCQDNRFVDNSPYNWTMGAVSGSGTTGIPDVQNFTPYVPTVTTPTTYSNWFDGTGDYLTVPNAAWMNLGTSDFTMECWTQFNTVGSTQMFVSNNYNAGNGAGGWAFLYRQDNTTLKFSVNSNVSYEKTFAPVVNRWYHVAVCRSGTDLRLFVDGTQIGTTSTSSDDITGASSTLFVGSNESNPLPINGLISNLRIVKGTALYTTNFTPSSAPLTNITNTQLLTCQDSTFKDNSVNAAVFTAYGNVKPVQSPTPFPPIVDQSSINNAYSTSLVGGSAYFDGTGDYLSTPSTTALQLSAATAFTIEAWVYPTSLPNTDHGIIGKRTGGTGEWQFFIKNDKTLHLYSTGGDYTSTTAISGLNQWIHCAVTWDLTTLRFFINGAVCSSTHTSIALGTPASSDVTVGASYAANELWYGYLSGVRVLKGTALYTKSFAPPIAPATPISNTSLLCNFTNGAIFDNTAKNVFETVGAVQLSTAQSKWGGSSIYFANGGTDYLLNPYVNNPNFSFGGDFTVELWVYPTSTPDTYNCIIGNFSESGTTYGWNLMLTSGQLVHVNVAGTSNNSAQTVPLNTWTHLAITRAGSTVYIFINGKRDTTTLTTSALAYNPVYPLRIGRQVDTTPRYFYGYMDDIRITKGYARYTTNFTPPTSSFQNQ